MPRFYMFLISLVFAYFLMLLDLHRSSHDVDICLGLYVSWAYHLERHIWSLLQVPWLESCRRWRSVDYLANLWSGSSFGMTPTTTNVSAQLKKGTQKQLPMLSKPQLSNVPFQCLHHYTWKGVTFGEWQHLFGVFPLSSMQENGNRSFHHPFVMKIVAEHTRLLLLQSLIPEPVNQLCEGFFSPLFVQSIGRSAE